MDTLGRHVGKWHYAFDISIGFGALVVLFFALTVYCVVVYINVEEVAKLKHTIKIQRKELRRLKKAAEQSLLNRHTNRLKEYGTIEDRKKQERAKKIVPLKPIEGRPGV